MSKNVQVINPNEHLDIPKWICAEYFKNIISKDEPNTVEVMNFVSTAAIPPGENFTSIMVRVHMDLKMKNGSMKHKSYLLKTMLDDDKGGELFETMQLFPKEMAMYQKYLPAFEALYKAAGVDIKIGPTCLFTEKVGRRITLVFEDLKFKNFENRNRLEGLDMNHMTSVLRKLAEFHAVSAVYKEQNGAFPPEFNFSSFPCSGDKVTKSFYYSRADVYQEAMMLWGMENAEKYVKKFPTYAQVLKSIKATMNTKKNTFNVLTHADFWTSNVMFNYDKDGALNELCFLDFQFCKWGSPAEDLIFFIGISAAKDIRVKEFDHFIEIYHERLIECLKLLRYKKPLPKLRELHMATFHKNNSFYSFFILYNHLLFCLLPKDKDCTVAMMMSRDEIARPFKMRALTNPIFVEAAKDLFKFYHQRGMLNFEDYDEENNE